MKDFLQTSDLTPEQLHQLLDYADFVKQNPMAEYGLLSGKTVVLYFGKPSTRTRISFETAVARLGGVPSTVGPQELQIGRGETLEDTAHVVSRYAEAFVIRTHAHDDVKLVADAASIPVINALTDTHHPCQSLADLMTLREAWGGTLEGKQLAYVGAGTNVNHSLIEAAAMAGLHMTVATAPGYEPDETLFAKAFGVAKKMGGSLNLMHDPIDAVKGADAVYTDAWVSMGDDETTRAQRFADLTPYRVTSQLMQHAAPSAVFLHCLPAHRGEEVTAEVIDGPRSIVFDLAENRLHTAHAVLGALIGGKLGTKSSGSVSTSRGVALPVATG